MCITRNVNAVKEKMEICTVYFLYIHLFDPLSSSNFMQNFGKNYACKLQKKMAHITVFVQTVIPP